jgi:hypothetical protein
MSLRAICSFVGLLAVSCAVNGERPMARAVTDLHAARQDTLQTLVLEDTLWDSVGALSERILAYETLAQGATKRSVFQVWCFCDSAAQLCFQRQVLLDSISSNLAGSAPTKDHPDSATAQRIANTHNFIACLKALNHETDTVAVLWKEMLSARSQSDADHVKSKIELHSDRTKRIATEVNKLTATNTND